MGQGMGKSPYSVLWKIVDGAIADAFNRHPDYLTPKGKRSARISINKRVTGTVLSFAEESARSRVRPADKALEVATSEPASPTKSDAGSGAHCFVAPTIHRVRIVNVVLKAPKRWNRYRSNRAFANTTAALARAVSVNADRARRGEGQ